jgi:general secretion pathway protein K
MMGRLKNESGFALILTLVITALMVAVLVEMVHQVYVDTSISRGFRDGQQASILAESGVMLVRKALSQNMDPTLLSSFLAKPLSDEVGSLEIKISDESGKINVNALVKPDLITVDNSTQLALQKLGESMKLPAHIWDAVVDWVDRDNALYSSYGAETPFYRVLKPPYSARNNKLMTLTELTLVNGFTPEILGKLGPYLTIFPVEATSQQININTATKEILALLLDIDINDQILERIVERRRLQPFKNPSELSQVPGINTAAATHLIGQITANGNLFRITAVAKVKESVRTIEAVVSNSVFLSWQEY